MVLRLNRTPTDITRSARNGINENWEKIERNFNHFVDEISAEALNGIINSARLIWQEPVPTFSDLVTSYPNAEEGWAAWSRETSNGVAKAYRYNGNEWILYQEFNGDAINEVDNRLTEELKEITTSITPAMFGAVGDGLSDDLEAFNRIIQYIITLPSTNLNFGGTSYNVTIDLGGKSYAFSDTWIIGTDTIALSDINIINGKLIPTNTFSSTDTISQNNLVRIGTPALRDAINGKLSTNIHFTEVIFECENIVNGVYCYHTLSPKFKECTFRNFLNNGLLDHEEGGNETSAISCYFTKDYNDRTGVGVSVVNDSKLNDNIFAYMGTAMILRGGGNVVTSNHPYGCSDWGLETKAASANNSITGNYFDGVSLLIHRNGFMSNILDNQFLSPNKYSSVYITSPGASILDTCSVRGNKSWYVTDRTPFVTINGTLNGNILTSNNPVFTQNMVGGVVDNKFQIINVSSPTSAIVSKYNNTVNETGTFQIRPSNICLLGNNQLTNNSGGLCTDNQTFNGYELRINDRGYNNQKVITALLSNQNIQNDTEQVLLWSSLQRENNADFIKLENGRLMLIQSGIYEIILSVNFGANNNGLREIIPFNTNFGVSMMSIQNQSTKMQAKFTGRIGPTDLTMRVRQNSGGEIPVLNVTRCVIRKIE